MRQFRFIVLLALSFCCFIKIAHAAQIQWELSFPFRQMGKLSLGKGNARYFDDKSVGERNWNFRKELYVHKDCLKVSRPIHCSERLLGEAREKRMRESMRLPPRKRLGSTKNNAWVAAAYIDRGNGYSADQYRYRSDYIHAYGDLDSNGRPYRHRVRVWLGDKKLKNRECEFRVYQATDWFLANCNEGTDKLSIARGEKSSTLQARIRGSDDIISLSGEDTKVREIVIAAVGDSYASGEGVPDIPARIRFRNDGIERIEAAGVLGGNRSAYNAAHWVDRNCHRSFLSSQARAAIHYAATHPQTETSLLHVACSGAEVLSGLLGPYSGSSEASGIKRAKHERGQVSQFTLSQYNQLIAALCRNPDFDTYNRQFKRYFSQPDVKKAFRKNGFYLPKQDEIKGSFGPRLGCKGGFKKNIDALMLGVGGNDNGFFEAIKYVLAHLIKGHISPKKAGDMAKKRIGPLYKLVDQANTEWLNVERSKVIVSLYPLGLKDENGRFCNSKKGLSSFNIAAALFDSNPRGNTLVAKLGTPKITTNESKALYEDFGNVLNQEIAKAAAKYPGWKLADEHLKWFDRHGWCAGNATIKRDSSYNPYELSERFIRTPDDGYASQNLEPAGYEKERSRVLNSLLKTYGMMHPNGLGAAVFADSYYHKLVEVLDR